MSSTAAFDTKERVRQAVDIVDLIGSYLDLRRQGRGYEALCPWHDDTRPSLKVYPERQSWKCWACDVGGDVFSFIMKREGVDFREALAMLAERADIPLPRSGNQAAVEPGSPSDKRTLLAAMAWAESQFHRCLLGAPEAEPARRYLKERGITEAGIEKFHLGFSPEGWQWLLDRSRTTPYSDKVLEAAGLVARNSQSGRPYDRFRGRVIFSIRDLQGRPIAMGGRVLASQAGSRVAKYINSPETRLFSKSDQLYGLDVVRQSASRRREVVIVEGYTDVVMASQMGLDNVVAVLGTALGSRHIRLLRRFADSITLVLDGDQAGQRRTNEILQLFIAEQIDLRVLTLPEGLDPCDFLRQRGAEAMRRLLDGAVDALEHHVRVETSDVDPTTDVHKANQALENILRTLAKSPRMTNQTTTAKRLREDQILARLARQFHVDEVQLRARMTELRRATRSVGSEAARQRQSPTVSGATIDPWHRELLEIITQQPAAVALAAGAISPRQLAPGAARQIYAKFCELSAAGDPADASRVLTELEDVQLKNLLVELDELGRQRSAAEWEPRLRGLIADFRRREEDVERRDKLSALKERRHNEQEELKILLELHGQDRQRQAELEERQSNRQGISAPMDG